MHVLAFASTIANTGFLPLAMVQDDVITTYNNRALLQTPKSLYFAGATGTTINRAKIIAPSFGPVAYPDIRPVQRPSVGIPQVLARDYRRSPFRLPAKEQFYPQALQSAAGNELETVYMGIADSLPPAVSGDIFTVVGSSTTAAVSSAWTSLVVTWETDLEGGWYQIVGGTVVNTTGVAFRLTLQNQVDRPGGACLRSIAHQVPEFQLPGGLGKWGEFESDSWPTPQVLCTGTDAAHTIFLDIVRSR